VTANFDRLARWYRYLELSSFGGAIARARFAQIQALAECRSILLLGDGDGRFLERLLQIAPQSTVHSVDASAGMLRLAAARLSTAQRARVTFEHSDALTAGLPACAYDGVATVFFLDCFQEDEAGALVERISSALRPGGIWLFADFAIPDRGLPRVVARAIVAGLYFFFRRTTDISARHLLDSEALIAEHGALPVSRQTFTFGLFRSVVFRR